MQTVLITGANGFVGQCLSQILVGQHRVVATGRGPARATIQHPNFCYHTLDFTSQEDIREVFSKFQPHVVVHAGAMSKPDECEQNKELAFIVNVAGTANLLNEAVRTRSHFVFLSTDFVFSGKEGMYREDDAPAPVNYYGHTKLLAETKVKGYAYDWSIVRTVLVYGNPGKGRPNILTSVAAALKEGKELNIFNDQVRTPTYVEDLAKGIASVIDKRAKGVYHISGEDVRTPYQIACAVADYLHYNKELIRPVTIDTFQQPALRPLKTGFNLSKAKRDLDYRPTSFEEGLQKTFASLVLPAE